MSRCWLLWVLAPLLVGLGCKGSSPDQEPAPRASPSAGAVESAPPPSAAPPPPEPAPSAPRSPSAFTPSPEPEASEWGQAPEIAALGARALGCEATMVREWLRVRCERGPSRVPTEIAVDRGRKARSRGARESLQARDGVMTLIQAILPGTDFAATFYWKAEEHVLTARWPLGSPVSERVVRFDVAAPAPRPSASPPVTPSDDWGAARVVNVPGAAALGCEARMSREALRVACPARGMLENIEVTRASHRARSRLAPGPALVVDLTPGTQIEALFSWADRRSARLVIWWPMGEMMPDPVGRFVDGPPREP